ncbi:glycosyltransferase [Eubacterium sp. MSJ-33]|uniref:glycosyltransferase n=1 Tax=Eubacterium sp. MSJ-33 TaxID=2841528 RepID=UPI001C770936|nr:glycosyltransferase [Eubacterium sp. MSJ-33]QWT52104.1 glycosyltransferase [Eubacterium sp. MSJ-33]
MNILIDGQTFNTPEIHRGIGVYVKSVINNLLRINYENEWYIAISNSKNLDELIPYAQSKLHIICNEAFTPCTDYEKNQDYTNELESIIQKNDIDIYWNPNPLMVNVLFPQRDLSCKMYFTVYDIIPVIFPDKTWAESIKTEYNRRLGFLREKNKGLIFISESSRKDFITHLEEVSEAYVTPLAADISLFYSEIQKNEGEPYILFTGGYDYRKNIDGAIEAYAYAMKKYRTDEEFARYKLVIVGAYNEETKLKYENKLKQLDIIDNVVLTGFVSDDRLAELYKKANLFFFPSQYEGFGLPILEAMLSGTFVLSADNSSLPEVCGGFAELCKAEDVQQMGDALHTAYVKMREESKEEAEKRQKYALQFSWEKTAKQILDIFENINKISLERKKLAIMTPWPNMQTGIANYIYKLVPYLQKYFEIDIYVDNKENLMNYEQNPVSIYQLEEYKNNNYEYTLYEIGNNVQFHKRIYDVFEEYSGIADIHDFMLTPFFFHAYFKNQKELYKGLLYRAYGDGAEDIYAETVRIKNHPNEQKYPMSEAVVRKASKAIFHNHWSKQQIDQKNVAVIPHACFDKEVINQASLDRMQEDLKKKMKYDGEVIIGCLGWINDNKRPQVILEAINDILKDGKKVKLCFWGKCESNKLKEIIKKYNIGDHVYCAGYMDKETYEIALQMTDIVVNLRYPSMGESSGTLCEALKYGKATIVSDLNQCREYPDDVCWKLPVGGSETKLLTAYIKYLIENPCIKNALEENAQNYADEVLAPDRIARMYYKWIVKE